MVVQSRKSDPTTEPAGRPKQRRGGGVLLRGLTLLLPPILTIVVLLWVFSTVESYVLEPVKLAARETLVWMMADVKDAPADADPRQNTLLIDGKPYWRLSSNQYVPTEIVQWLEKNVPSEPLPATGEEVYRRYVEARHLRPQVVIPVFLCVFVLLLYVLGKFLGGEIVGLFDWGVLHLPLVRKVYGAVKQVTAFVFGEAVGEAHQLPFRRVVAIEYPRPGLWSIGLVMGDAVLDVTAAANEPCVTVMLPTSPALFTVKPVMIPLSKTHDVNMTIDQALQYVISCGVVLPPHQLANSASGANGDLATRSQPANEQSTKPKIGN